MADEILDPNDPRYPKPAIFETQVVLSVSVGLLALLSFCVVRLRWSKLYMGKARKSQGLPDLAETFAGWMPGLYGVTEQQVLEYAGLDAFVFLGFFKMAIKFLAISALASCVVIAPIQYHYREQIKHARSIHTIFDDTDPDPDPIPSLPDDRSEQLPFLWAYAVFAYLFTFLALYTLYNQTNKVVSVRQAYLDKQASVTSRTIRLTGVPAELQSERALSEHLTSLHLGEVESISICRAWNALDALFAERENTLRKLEEAYTVYLGRKQVQRDGQSLPISQPRSTAIEVDSSRSRPHINLGVLGLTGKRVDAITHFTVKLTTIDTKIEEARVKQYSAVPMAFVTFRSMQSAQIAAQAVLDPLPKTLHARLAPAPADVIWTNTYLSRRSRVMRAWGVSFFTIALAVLWVFPISTLAALLNINTIRKVWPSLAEFLLEHQLTRALVQGVLPTLGVSIFNALVPYIYDWFSSMQGYISKGDLELSVVSKYFFYLFFNLLIVFTGA